MILSQSVVAILKRSRTASAGGLPLKKQLTRSSRSTKRPAKVRSDFRSSGFHTHTRKSARYEVTQIGSQLNALMKEIGKKKKVLLLLSFLPLWNTYQIIP